MGYLHKHRHAETQQVPNSWHTQSSYITYTHEHLLTWLFLKAGMTSQKPIVCTSVVLSKHLNGKLLKSTDTPQRAHKKHE